MVDTAVVGGDIMIIEEEPFLYCKTLALLVVLALQIIRLLKLVIGVDISTRPVNKPGSPGNEVNRSRRAAAAAPNSAALLLSMSIMGHLACMG